ncbi:MAG: membrane integrity-associated transporter subunit PqiC [Desulfovibrio sp.]|uniref:PqiC family protein n=1 Tax=Desulfovibrio sp. TaxID=885 RepID=UPI001A757876|nr:PqiC family protein [Desulfovibrio sp.]MBD5416197.1 membrane integrity-associated transporter subunit PqiC [Desulfovibrio sp.]
MPRILTLLALLALGLAALAGCGRSKPTNYYLLESGMPPVTADDLPPATLRVAMVEVPSYLNRNNIVSRVAGETRLILAEFHLWAEPVSNGVRRVVEETLTPPLLEAGVTVLPTGTANGGDYVLLIDVQRLDGNFNEKAVLESRWTLLDKKEAPLADGIFAAEEMVGGNDYNVLVAAESRLVRRMGDYLAEKLPPLLKRR